MALPKGLEQHRGNQGQGQDADYPTLGVTQYIPADPGPPPLGQYAPAISVRVVTPTPPVTYLFLTVYQDLLENRA